MNGAAHYREAERLLSQAASVPELPGQIEDWLAYRESDLAAAQVHATLALAAATAYPAIRDYCGDDTTEPRDWAGATS